MAFRRRPAGLFRAAAVLLGATLVTIARADEAEDVAKPLSNPVASFPFNHDRDIGPARDGSRWLLNIPPVLPFGLTEKGNLISHTILLVLQQKDLFPGAGRQSGIGDVVQGVFFSPKAPTAGGVIWGAGPVFLIPTGSNHLLTTDKCGVGPSRMARRQDGPSIAGVLANPIWSFAGNSRRADVNAAFVQPFLTYTTRSAANSCRWACSGVTGYRRDRRGCMAGACGRMSPWSCQAATAGTNRIGSKR